MSDRNAILTLRRTHAPTPMADTPSAQQGRQLTELPPLDLAGVNLSEYATYVRKLPPGGELDYRLTLEELFTTLQDLFPPSDEIRKVWDKVELRALSCTRDLLEAHVIGGVVPFDNQGGIYISVQSQDADNDGDRIRPDNFQGFVWYKWM